ncbi:glycosyltransferase family 1 protein [Sediminicoccus sp. KRV36]|uniref:glycosyltransferase family 4 protein n=1 Tax=Sediminicoccus sp. KRV36 TaxID=3133721 RepID=UPI002010692C|nr:glycosyltransferase family 1 protein [Sediminicoccus rosea]UPY38150.1 glycosyltransferase family 4 protein [Sediminicoccus rosea]
MQNGAPRVWMDGFPLTLSHGTGITTYARGHAATLRAIGVSLGMLYGRPLPGIADAAEREVRFFDARVLAGRPLHQRFLSLLRHPRGPLAQAIPLSRMVDTSATSAITYESFATANLPQVDELWNADDIFGRAQLHFALRGSLMPVRAPTPPPALMHWTHIHPIRLAGTRNIYTVHDLIPLRLPWATLDFKANWLNAIRMLARRADHIVAVSEHARQDMITQVGIAEERITNTYQAVFPPQYEMDEAMSVARLRRAHQLEPRGYFLFLSRIEPRKNLARMLDAYIASGSQTPFIIVGGLAHHGKQELRLLTEANGTRSADGRIRYLGYVPQLDVEILLRHARALCFASLYEGFGLPAMEAMRAGTAVLTSNTSCMPEIVGDAAMTVTPTDTRALAEALRALDQDAGLRARLEAAGPVRAAFFSPERYAGRLRALYARLGVLPGRETG